MHTIIDHPLAQNCITMMRNEATSSRNFREAVWQVSSFLAYEALRDLRLETVTVKTPVADTEAKKVKQKTLIVPVLRAGLGMLDAVLRLLPDSKVGVLGMRRNEQTACAESYYENLPTAEGGEIVLVIDPMLATGGTACDAVARLKALGYRDIRFLCLVSAPEGIARFEAEHPDVAIFTASKDQGLNSDFYIVPGLGDAGDRIFGA